MPVRPRQPAGLPACVASLRRVHEASGYPSRWPDTAAAVAAEHDLVPVLDVVADSAPAVALYEQAGWHLAGIQLAT